LFFAYFGGILLPFWFRLLWFSLDAIYRVQIKLPFFVAALPFFLWFRLISNHEGYPAHASGVSGALNYGFVVEIFGFLFSIVHEFFHSSF